jgi:hypothetical protein
METVSAAVAAFFNGTTGKSNKDGRDELNGVASTTTLEGGAIT